MLSSPPWYSRRLTAVLLLATALVTAAFLLLAPTERTLGEGIRIVYLHVALVWVGMAALYTAGVAGLVVAVTGRPSLARWMEALAWIGFLFYALSAAVSLVAQEVNWGGISWQEPRTVAMFQIVALALIVRVLNSWSGNHRLQGVLNVLVALALFWSARTTTLQLHPEDAVGSSTAQGIRLTFFALTALFVLVAGWLTLFWHARGQGAITSGRTGGRAVMPTDGSG
jgi:hypothetical protein